MHKRSVSNISYFEKVGGVNWHLFKKENYFYENIIWKHNIFAPISFCHYLDVLKNQIRGFLLQKWSKLWSVCQIVQILGIFLVPLFKTDFHKVPPNVRYATFSMWKYRYFSYQNCKKLFFCREFKLMPFLRLA